MGLSSTAAQQREKKAKFLRSLLALSLTGTGTDSASTVAGVETRFAVMMKSAISLVLPTTLMLLTNTGAQAQQQVETSIDRPFLALVEGDSPSSCSFISPAILERSADLVQGLFFVQRGDSPDQVQYKMRFIPDRSYAGEILEWTAVAGQNYTKASVNFNKSRVSSRTFTMAINYNQPNEKRCLWEVQEPQQNTQPSTQQNQQDTPTTPSSQ